MLKYCVAQVNNYSHEDIRVGFFAYNKLYRLHLAPRLDDPDIIWYDLEQEAMNQRHSPSDCVISRWFD